MIRPSGDQGILDRARRGCLIMAGIGMRQADGSLAIADCTFSTVGDGKWIIAAVVGDVFLRLDGVGGIPCG